MAYSKFTRKQAGVLYRAYKTGTIKMTDGAVKMMYNQADAYINHDAVFDDVEDRLCKAVDAIFQNDLETAQKEFDRACFVYGCHCGVEIRAI